MPNPASMSLRFCRDVRVGWMLFALLAGCAYSGAVAKPLTPDQWNKKNVPVVRKYLLVLKLS